jgi:hypothetical protein
MQMSDKKRSGKNKTDGDVRIGEPIKREVRVKINVMECAVKEAKVVKLEIAVKKIQLKMAPLKQEITKLNKEIDKLCADVDSSTEERTVLVREEFHYRKNLVRVVEAKGGALVEERTMTKAETQFDLTQKPAKEAKPKGSRRAAHPAFQPVVDASDAQPEIGGEA